MTEQDLKEFFDGQYRRSGMTMQQLADVAGIPRGTMENWLQGRNMGHTCRVLNAMEALGFEVRIRKTKAQ